MTRSSLGWNAAEISPISSRKMVPPSAAWKTPIWSRFAPVKAPLVWPKSSLSSSVSGSAAQLIRIMGRVWRGEKRWIRFAKISFPHPVSPVSSTDEFVAATFRARSKTLRITSPCPTSSGVSASRWVSAGARRARRSSAASSPLPAATISRTSGISSFSMEKGFVR